jgi:hypothetical protein
MVSVQGSEFKGSGFRVQGSEFKGSAPPPAKKTVVQIEIETD